MPKAPDIRLKKIYDPPDRNDGARVLVDRLWPRGARKEEAKLTLLKDMRREGVGERGRGGDDVVSRLDDLIKAGPVTLLYAAHDAEHNHARVLADYLEGRA